MRLTVSLLVLTVVGTSAAALTSCGGGTSAAPASAPPSSADPAAGRRAAETPVAPVPAKTGIFVNEHELTATQVDDLRQTYGAAAPPGHYWYDGRSGMYGVWGYEVAGVLRPAHALGDLSPLASRGDTGVFINGRQINRRELNFYQQVFEGAVQPGRIWLDATGLFGAEGNAVPIGNLVLSINAYRLRARGGGDYTWRDGHGATAGSSGNCTWIAIPGADTRATAGCG